MYKLSLASYDPLSITRSRVSVEVCVSSQTRMLNTTPAEASEVLRCHGMVFSSQGHSADGRRPGE